MAKRHPDLLFDPDTDTDPDPDLIRFPLSFSFRQRLYHSPRLLLENPAHENDDTPLKWLRSTKMETECGNPWELTMFDPGKALAVLEHTFRLANQDAM